MRRLNDHLRKTFLAGFIAAIPLGVTGILAIWLDSHTRSMAKSLTTLDIPFLGILLALVFLWVLGLIVNSLLGRMLTRHMDHVLSRLPILSPLYAAWKQVLVIPGGGAQSIFSHVVLVLDPVGWIMGFTNGNPLESDPNCYCVFVPAAPNPISGRLYFVARDRCRFVKMTTEDAFKLILSSGNYVPNVVGAVTVEPWPVGRVTDSPR
jgi:uncharacterized membrane protein